MVDSIIKLDGSTVQHGKHNNRIYIMKLGKETHIPPLLEKIDKLAKEQGYSKIFGKIPESAFGQFKRGGFVPEAKIPSLFAGKEDGVIVSRFLSADRIKNDEGKNISNVLEICRDVGSPNIEGSLSNDYSWGIATLDDIPAMVQLYRETFSTYPFPIQKQEYISETMLSNVVYFYIRYQGNFIALSSAEMDKETESVEMTDFATHDQHRGRGLATFLLSRMEEEMLQRDMRTAYTIARALSPGINITFAKCGYTFGGTLINNTNIAGSLESMNVWYKSLAG